MFQPAGIGSGSSSSSLAPPGQKPPGLPPNPPAAPPGHHPRAKRRSVTVACEPCRKRKSKCDAARPICFPCQRHDTHCVYETVGAETHSQALKRKNGELGAHIDSLTRLYQILGSRTESDARDIFDQIRSGVDPDTLYRRIKESDLLIQLAVVPPTEFRYVFPFMPGMPSFLEVETNPYLGSKLYEHAALDLPRRNNSPQSRPQQNAPWEHIYRIPFHTCRLAEPLIDRVKPSDWTLVSSDDDMMRQLLETYFRFEFPFQSFFHKDMFLRDMASGQTNCCSSLLVNTVLASACHGHPKIRNRANFWDPHSLSYRFLAEAKRLWELELDKSKITTVQAGALLARVINGNGLDRVGTHYLSQAITMGKNMAIFGPLDHIRNMDKRRVWAITAWGVFCFQSSLHFHFYLEPILKEPPVEPLPDYRDAKAYYGELYCRYPGYDDLVPMHHGLTTMTIAQFRVIMNDMSVKVNTDTFPQRQRRLLQLEETLRFRDRLMSWYADLPPALTAYYLVLPSHLKLHMHYYNMLMCLFEPLLSPAHPRLAQEAEAMGLNAKEIMAHCEISLEFLVRIYYLRHGFEHWDGSLMQWLVTLGFGFLKELYSPKASTDPERRNTILSTVLLCLQGLREQGNNFYVGEAIFTLMRKSMNPEDVQPLWQKFDIEKEEKRKSLVADQVRSSWPMGIVSVADDPEEKRLGRMIEATPSLSSGPDDDWPNEETPSQRRGGFREVVLPDRGH